MRIAPWLVLATLTVSCAQPSTGAVSEEAGASEDALRGVARAELELVRTIEDHRLLGDARLTAFTKASRASTASAALVAIGRIGDASLAGDVRAALSSPSPRVRAAAAFALGMLGTPPQVNAAKDRLAIETDAHVRAALASAVGRAGVAGDLPVLTAMLLGHEDAHVRGAAAEGVGTIAMHAADAIPLDAAVISALLALAKDEKGAPATRAAFALAMTRGAGTMFAESETLAAFAGARDASARAYLTRILRRVATDAARNALFAALGHEPDAIVRAQTATQLGRLGASAPVVTTLQTALADSSSQVVEASLEALGTLAAGAATAAPAVQALATASPSAWLRASALAALVQIDAVAARTLVDAALAHPGDQSGLVAVSALASYGTAADQAKLATYATYTDFKVATAAVNAAATLPVADVTPELKKALRTALASNDQAVVAAVAAAAQGFAWTDFAADLNAAYDTFASANQLDTRVAILGALAVIGSSADVLLVTRALADNEHTVVEAAAAAYKALTGTEAPSPRVASYVAASVKTPDHHVVDRALATHVLLWTTRGMVTLDMLPEAPLTATNFVALVDRGFYDNTTFHRVIPDFVAQGGDPRGDGNGGADALVREEIGAAHTRGTVGMATSGKDTGSSQFFFNHGYNTHLDDAYTAFAKVTSGLDVAERLEIGDRVVFAITF